MKLEDIKDMSIRTTLSQASPENRAVLARAMNIPLDEAAPAEGETRPVGLDGRPKGTVGDEQAPSKGIDQIAQGLPTIQLARLGGREEQMQRSQLASQLMAQQQAAQRQLAQAQARAGVMGGAAAAQQARLARQMEAERMKQEEAGQLERTKYNIQQSQQEQFANLATELAKRQLQVALRGQEAGVRSAEALAQAQRQAASSGKIICTELYAQGFMSHELFDADQNFGLLMARNHPEVMAGYHRLARPVVQLMQKSKAFTRMVSWFALPWAKHMGFLMGVEKRDSFFGSLIMMVGMPVCKAFGKGVAYASN